MAEYEDDAFDIALFQPTKRQQYVKHKLHHCVDPQEIGRMTIDNIQRVRHYFYPIPIEEVRKWALDIPVFWQWLVIANEQTFELNALKPAAVNCIKNILNGEVADGKLAMTQLKAAQLLLSISDRPPMNVTKNTMNIKGTQGIPKMLANKTTGQIQEEILKLEQAVDVNVYSEEGDS